MFEAKSLCLQPLAREIGSTFPLSFSPSLYVSRRVSLLLTFWRYGTVIKKVRTGLGQSDKPFALTSHINLRQSCVCQTHGQLQIVQDLSRQIVENGVRSLCPNLAGTLSRWYLPPPFPLSPFLSFAREFCEFCEFCTTLQEQQQQQQRQPCTAAAQRSSSPTAS